MLQQDRPATSGNRHRGLPRVGTRTLKLLFLCTLIPGFGYASSYFSLRSVRTPQSPVDFAREIQPIFQATCFNCHGPKKAAGQLRLDLKSAAMKGGLSGPIIVPGNSKQSRLLMRILGEGGEARMPMNGDPLKSEQIALIRQWIDEGAQWPESDGAMRRQGDEAKIQQHWAYVKPVRSPLPAVKNAAWVRNPIDQFILARLEKEGLSPAPEAAKEMLLRRVFLDLTGLPPGVTEVDEFLADQSPDAYEKAVDRLLASPHYGERWARPWLDLARYADSNGYEKDNLRVMWKYRDWVINALNKDLPFDQFTIEQIAGDMLPNATTEQKIATGFHRNTLLNQEGGVDPEEARYEVLVDRVNTTATVWLGSTMACTQCHNHKYDPFTQKDYYRMYAFFEGAEYQIGYQGEIADFTRYVKEPVLDLPTPEQEAKRDQLKNEITRLEKVLKTQTPQLDTALAAWEKELLADPARWRGLDPVKFESTGGTTLTEQEDHSLLASGHSPEFDEYIITAKAAPGKITALMVEAMADKRLPRGGPGRDLYGHFILSTIEASANGQPLTFVDGNWDDGLSRFEKSFFNQEQMAQISDRPRGWLINAMNDEVRLNRQAVFVLEKSLVTDQPLDLTIRLKFLAGGLCQGIGRVRLAVTDSGDPLKSTKLPASLKPVLSLPADKRTDKQQAALAERFRNFTPLLKKERDQLVGLQKQVNNLGIVTALVMQEKPSFERPSTRVRERGSFNSTGDKVYAATPAVLPPMPESAQANRLGLAKWLVDENNPLTARVAVNRFWEHFFGRGIVETSEDFGTQGAPPSHPELLDWLAVELMTGGQSDGATGRLSTGESHGGDTAITRNMEPGTRNFPRWSMKAIHRLIVTSATYCQDSTVSPALQERDPYNRLLARGPRFRVEAEMVRDIALAASGLLSHKTGGPSVMPPQPDGIWRNPYSEEKWVPAKGQERYRRGLYTFIRRTSPYPAMVTFDATSREVCTVRRVRTNTPLQSLTMLNDEAAMEMARALAKRMFAEVSGDPKSRAAYGFRLCLTRKPTAIELERLVALYNQQLANYKASPQAAEQLVKGEAKELPAPELAAWTIVANVLLNLDETLTKQ